ncbi:hypothetical protein [Antrihabitans stalactiti]|uniref:Uncharacterized protein n=1 Tax=Antrihabitans stalactiti TaxID=2584121 RepID=A0A848KAN9_9NOCA|nr:hypothetical protein [Antrihabitans stalactiti]NMN94746.1 hypothetical protein [Antrihabitans stalactiti]
MTTDPCADDMRVLALTLISSFSRAQDAVDGAARGYFEHRVEPMMSWLDDRGATKRIRDDHRPELLELLKKAGSCDADLDLYGATYRKVKAVRDNIGHSARIELLDHDRMRLQTSFFSSSTLPETRPVNYGRVAINNRIRDAEWLLAQAMYVSASLAAKLFQGGQEIVVIKPTADPRDWTGELMRPV